MLLGSGVEVRWGQALKGSVCPIEELGLYPSAVRLSKKRQAGDGDIVPICFAHHYVPGKQAKACTQQGLSVS